MSGVGNNLNTSAKTQSTFPFVVGSARNGLSVDATGRIVLGQDVGAVGDPAVLLSNRDIPMNGFRFQMIDSITGNRRFVVDPGANFYGLGNMDALGPFAGGRSYMISPAGGAVFQHVMHDDLGIPLMFLGDRVATQQSQFASPNFQSALLLDETSNIASLQIIGAATVSVQFGTGLVILDSGAAVVFKSAQTQTNYAGAGAGTIANAPHAGNPDKWVAFNDNGTIRKFPTWI
jgi:hypothetical protein